MKTLFWASLVLTIVGGINWGLVGFFGIDGVATLTGGYNIASQAVYGLVGVASVALAVLSSRVVLLSVDPEKTRRTRTRRRTRAVA